MKRIGLIGGMSWESSALYYELINEGVKRDLGGLHSADCVLTSVDFDEVERMQSDGRWADAGALLARRAHDLEAAGAEVLVLCTNTMHKVADAIEAAAGIPLLHLADVTADAVISAGIRDVGLLGTRFTMEESFYRERLERSGLTVHVPNAEDRVEVDRVIYDELVLGVVDAGSRRRYRQVIDRLVAEDAQGVILGCTEIELLITQEDSPVPVFPTTRLHADAAVRFALDV